MKWKNISRLWGAAWLRTLILTSTKLFFFCASMQISCKLLVNKCRALLNTQDPNAGLQTKHFAYCKRSGIHNFLTVFQIVSVLQGRTVHLLKTVQVCCVLNKIRTKQNESVSFLVIANKPASLPDLHRYIYIYIDKLKVSAPRRTTILRKNKSAMHCVTDCYRVLAICLYAIQWLRLLFCILRWVQ